MNSTIQPNPKLDLVLERTVDVSSDLVWLAWTTPKHILKWFTPAPWKTVECKIDLRPGGEFYTVMQSPEGQNFPNIGCFLEIIDKQKLVWTSALLPGYRPAGASSLNPNCPFLFSAAILLEAQGNRTRYTAIAIHPDEASRKRHEEMGFREGWGAALDQLVEAAKKFGSSEEIVG